MARSTSAPADAAPRAGGRKKEFVGSVNVMITAEQREAIDERMRRTGELQSPAARAIFSLGVLADKRASRRG